MKAFTKIGNINASNLAELFELCQEYQRCMFQSNGYAPKRKELHIRRFVRLPSSGNPPKVELVADKLGGNYIKHFKDIERIEALGDRLLPGFHQGILMHYPEGASMKRHRDHWVYARGAAQVNISGEAILSVDGTQYPLTSGECIRFDNMLPHSVRALSERWCICFFYLKNKYLTSEN